MKTTTVTIDTSGMAAWKTSTESKVRTALFRAGTDAQRRARAEGNRQIRARKKNLRLSSLTSDRAIRITQPQGPKDVLVWKVMAGIVSLPVWAYKGGRKTPTGWAVTIKEGSRSLIPHAFRAKMKSGKEGIFMRYGQATRVATSRWKGHARYAGQKRQPIRELYTSGISPAFEAGIPAMAERARTAFIASVTRSLTPRSR